MLTADDFRAVDLLADQPDDALAWLAAEAEEHVYPEGARPFRPGDPAEHMIVVLAGGFQIFVPEGGQRLLFATVRAGEISGLLPFSRMTTFEGEGIAVAPLRMALLHRRHFPMLIARMPAVAQRLVARLTDRVRESSRLDQQREKMMALGKLSAGLAHELNNPAAAIGRAADALRARQDALPGLVQAVGAHGLAPAQLGRAADALRACTAPVPGTRSALDRADHEDALADWLADRDVPDAYLLAETLADEGVSVEALEHLATSVPAPALADTIRWIEHTLAARRLVDEIASASGRVSALVASVKTYTHMDAARDRQPTDLHAGLDSTLTMLGHAIRERGVRVERAYADDMPPVPAYPGEINQVWTNLLDNALDAAGPGGTVRIETAMEGVLACVRIVDSGPGIPEDIRARIFEPFFSTKPPGAGTGLGLDIARRIVLQHEGTIRVESRPGRTVFQVCLPADASCFLPDGSDAQETSGPHEERRTGPTARPDHAAKT